MKFKKEISIFLTLIFSLSIPFAVFADENADKLRTQILAKMTDEFIFSSDNDYFYSKGAKQNIELKHAKYAPIRTLFSAVNSKILWNDDTKTATALYMNYEISFVLDEKCFYKKDTSDLSVKKIDSDNAAVLSESGKTIISLETFAQAIDYNYVQNENIFIVGRNKNEILKNPKALLLYQELFDKTYNSKNIQKVFYVDPVNGRDFNDGSLNSPFASITTARDVVREYIKENDQTGNIEIYLRKGEFQLEKTIDFSNEDSGKNGYDIIYKAFPNENVIIKGGKSVHGWEKYNDKIFRAYVGLQSFNVMFENEDFAQVARHPNMGYNKAISMKEAPVNTSFMFNDGDLPQIGDFKNVEVSLWPGGPNGEWNWSQIIRPVKNIDYKDNTLYFGDKSGYVLGTGSRYFLQGALELLDTTGEFYHSLDGYVYYYPKNENIENQNITIPITGEILSFKGESSDNTVHNISFENVTITNSDRNISGIKVQNSRNLKFDSCKLYNTGGNGITIDGYGKSNIIENCLFYNIGADAILLNGVMGKKESENCYNILRNNVIHDMGIIYGGANGISVTLSDYNYIGHNTIYNSKRSCIALSGRKMHLDGQTINGEFISYENWNEYSHCFDNVIEYNNMYNSLTDSQDGGSLYAWNAGRGNIIRNNALHSSSVLFSFAYPFYLDDGTDYTYAYNNIVFNNQNEKTKGVQNAAYMVKGVGNKIYNNIAANNQRWDGAIHKDAFMDTLPMDCTPNRNITSYRNISYNSGNYGVKVPNANFDKNKYSGKILTDPPENRIENMDYNLYYNDENKYLFSINREDCDLNKWLNWKNAQYDGHSIFGSDPEFMNPQMGDYRLKYNSPAYMLGFSDINFKDIGTTSHYPFAPMSDTLKQVYVNVENKINNSFYELKIGESIKLQVNAKTTKDFCVDMKKATVTFESDNKDVATVEADGTVVAKNKGIAKIKSVVSYNNSNKTTDFYIVVADSLKEISVEIPKEGWTPEVTKTATVKAVTQFGRPISLEKPVFSSSDTSILEVSQNGSITAKKAGDATIYAVAYVNGEKFESSVAIHVKDSIFGNFKYSLEKNIIKANESTTVKLSSFDTKGENLDIKNCKVSVKSLNSDTVSATYDEKGNVLLGALKNGNAVIEITVLADGNSQTQSFALTVTDENDKINSEWKVSNYSKGTDGKLEIYESGLYDFQTNGINIWNKEDQGTFGYKEILLDENNEKLEITIKYSGWPGEKTVDNNGNQSHLGIMVREKDTVDSKNFVVRNAQSDGSNYITFRSESGGDTKYKSVGKSKNPVEIKLIRDKNQFRGYYKDASTSKWELISETSMDMGNKVLIGICGFSGNFDMDKNQQFVGMVGNIDIKTGENAQMNPNLK